MEKLIYVLVDSADRVDDRHERIAEHAVPAARAVGGERIVLLVPDQVDEIRERSPIRIGGEFDRVSAVLELWLPSMDGRAPVEEALTTRADTLWGYLVTESTIDPCPHDVTDGARVPGITQWATVGKPAAVALEDFYREWAVHSELSFGLHPHRESYVRNAVARALTPGAPAYLGIVNERFPSLEHFLDGELYFGDKDHVARVMEHLPTFYDFALATTGGFSEFRWR